MGDPTDQKFCQNYNKKDIVRRIAGHLKRRQNVNYSSKQHDSNSEHAFVTQAEDKVNIVHWYVNSGASFHETSNKDLFVHGSLESIVPSNINSPMELLSKGKESNL